MTYRILVVDDERNPAEPSDDNIQVVTVRTCEDALELLEAMHEAGDGLDELWLDYSLGRGGDIFPVLLWLEKIAKDGKPFEVVDIHAHTSSGSGQELIIKMLQPHYNVFADSLPEEPA